MWDALKDEVSRTISGTGAGVTGPGGTSPEILFLACLVECGTDMNKWSSILDRHFKYHMDWAMNIQDKVKQNVQINSILSWKLSYEEYIVDTIRLMQDQDMSNMLLYLNNEDKLLYKAVATWRLRENIAGVSGIQDNRLSDPSDAEKWNFYEFEDFDTVD